MTEELRKPFHDKLEQMRLEIVRMCALVTEMIPRATDAFLNVQANGTLWLSPQVALSLPAENGQPRNLTRTSGVAEPISVLVAVSEVSKLKS